MLKAGAIPVGAGLPANTGKARAMDRGACFAAEAAVDRAGLLCLEVYIRSLAPLAAQYTHQLARLILAPHASV